MSLKPGQLLVLSDYLCDFIAHDEFDPKRYTLMTSEDIAYELQDMCDFDKDDISDYMADNGFKFSRFNGSCMHGWVLERVNAVDEDY